MVNILDKSALISLDSGQAFRWQKNDSGLWQGVLGDCLYVLTDDVLLNIESNGELHNFFNMSLDWNSIVTDMRGIDKYLDSALDEFNGLRILHQNPFETILSFIISSCNNITRIKKIIESFCRLFGKPVRSSFPDGFNINGCFSFPSVADIRGIKPKDLEACKMGFRSEYICDAVEKISSGEVDLQKIDCLDYEQAILELKKIKGIGDKVASCILLFSYSFLESFPKDVWIKRVMKEKFNGMNENIFGKYAGVAQQYLFMKVRSESNGR